MERCYENEQDMQVRQGEERIAGRPCACRKVLEELEEDARVLYGEIERLEAHIRKLKADIERAERACLGNFPPVPPVPPVPPCPPQPPCRPCHPCQPCHKCGCGRNCRG